MAERIAFRMNLFEGHAAEYEKRHDEIFPDLAQALSDAGVSDYTIWHDPTYQPLPSYYDEWIGQWRGGEDVMNLYGRPPEIAEAAR